MRKVRKGELWRPPPANDYNAMVDAAEFHARHQRLGTGGRFGNRPPGVVGIYNGSGSNLAAGAILALNDVVIDADQFDDSGVEAMAWAENLVWSGTTPSTSTYDHIGRFAVLTEPIPNGSTGACAAAGIAVAQLSVGYSDHPYADIANGSTTLTTNWYGAAEILYKVQVGSVWWGVVRLGSFQSPIYKGIIEESGGISPGSSGDVDIHYAGADTNETVTAHLWMEGSNAAAEDAECLVQFFRDEQKWYITEMEC